MTREFMILLLITLFITSCKATSLHCQIHEGSRKCRRVHAYSNSYLINKMSFAVQQYDVYFLCFYRQQVTLTIHLKPFAIISSVGCDCYGKGWKRFRLELYRQSDWYDTHLVIKKTYIILLLYDITLLFLHQHIMDNLCTTVQTKRYKT